jgi:hypothetical protein
MATLVNDREDVRMCIVRMAIGTVPTVFDEL